MNKDKLLQVVFCICLPVFLLLFSYHSTLLFYSKTEAQSNALAFVNGASNNLSLNYTAAEISHLEDVQGVISGERFVFFLSYLGVLLIFGTRMKDKPFVKKLLKSGGTVTLVFMVIVLLFSFLSFDQLFSLFHQIFFPQGNWLFPPDSFLIKTFPIDFFVKVSLFIFIQTLILASFLIGAGFLIKDGHAKQKN
jgi:integral membrane protein (TIGR01906 family)